jgi:hypothetical protein
VKFSGTIQLTLNVTWTGALQSAVLQFTTNGQTLGVGTATIAVKVNGVQVFQDPDSLLILGGTGFAETAQSVSVQSFVKQGNNVIEFDVIQTFGEIATVDFAANGTLTVESSGTVDGTGNTNTSLPWQTLAVLAIIVIGIIAVGYLIGEVKA